jgi:hypothetical protein
VLVGGAGVDTLSSGAGVDRVVASDGDRDTIDCGLESPDEALVASSGVEGSIAGCEQVVRVRPPASSTGPLVGSLRLADAPGEVRLTWTHPRRWRDLRAIRLVLLRGGEPVARVALHVRRGEARGDARLVRLARRGRRVEAQLRLSRSLADGVLHVDVEAIDTRGRRQFERGAGRIEVAR